MERETVIRTLGLTRNYGRIRAVDDLNLEIRRGEIFGFLGPNGAGKTTTILMLLGLTRPSEGKAIVCGFDPEREACRIKQQVGYLPENVGFYPDLNAVESLWYIADLNGIKREAARRRIEKALQTVDLAEGESLKKKVGTFSRGMKQRLGIAEVLVKQPSVLILDEPTLGLDPEAAHRIIELIRNLSNDRGITVLLSSHHLEQVQRISDRVGIMIRGKLAAQGSVAELADKRFGLKGDKATLEEIYMDCFDLN